MLMSNRMHRTALPTLAVVLLIVAGCGGSSDNNGSSSGSGGSSGGGATPVKLLNNWFPEPETGGFYQAAAKGIDKQHGVQLKVLPGGPQVQTIPQVASGQAQFGIANADQILLAREQGVPVVAVYATFNKYLQCLMYHADAGISGPSDINGHNVAVVPGPNYWLWVKEHFGLDNAKEVNFSGTLSQFKLDKNLVQQCFVTNEPYVAKQLKIPTKYFVVADLGFNPYGNMLFTTESTIKDNPKLVRDVVATAKAGWESYLRDPAPANAMIKKEQPQTDPGQAAYADKTMGAYIGKNPGAMTSARWKTLYDQMQTAHLLKKSADPNDAFTTKFLK